MASLDAPSPLDTWLDDRRAATEDDPASLLDLVDRALKPTRRFYDYWQANDYAASIDDVVDLLADRAAHATPGLIPVIERAITLTTRAILKSDDSSGAQGDQIHSLLDAHALAARTSTPPLTQAEQTRLITWIVTYRYGGQQDFFDPDIVAYAPCVSAKSIEQYRTAIAGIELGPYGTYPLTRLAVLDRDRDAIVAANGGEPHNAMLAARLVSDLEEAGLHGDAVAYARLGVGMETRGWDQKLVTFLVDDALQSGEAEEAVKLRRDWFARFESSSAFESLRKTAEHVGAWDRERTAAEARLAQRDPASFALYLLGDGRGDDAWRFASEHLSTADRGDVWLKLSAHRAKTHPADTLPVYRGVIEATLTVTDVRNYRSAAKMLKQMRSVSDAAGPEASAAFAVFVAELAEQNRRRPRCIQEFTKAGLLAPR